MFWTDWGSNARIERATMHGENRRTIVASDLTWPNGITVDFTGNKIYWTDAGKDRIEVADFDGRSRMVSFEGNDGGRLVLRVREESLGALMQKSPHLIHPECK